MTHKKRSVYTIDNDSDEFTICQAEEITRFEKPGQLISFPFICCDCGLAHTYTIDYNKVRKVIGIEIEENQELTDRVRLIATLDLTKEDREVLNRVLINSMASSHIKKYGLPSSEDAEKVYKRIGGGEKTYV